MERATVETIGIKALAPADIKTLITEEFGLPAFRYKQLVQWIYGKGARSYDDMSNLPAALREDLAQKYPLNFPTIVTKKISKDGTRKYLLEFCDGNRVETVGIPSKNRLTVCVSTQVGCPLRCAFCATGRSGYVRNLGCGEIVDQVQTVADDFGQRVSSVVFMGQGEPFLNYDATMNALRILNDESFFGIGARHLTVSTAGVLPQIRRFASEPEQFTFAISLHSAIQETRDELMPGVRKYPLDRLRDSIISYTETTGRRPSYEYAMIDGINDTDEHLKALDEFCRKTLCHVNLIQLNEVPGSSFHPSSTERVNLFVKTLNNSGTETTVRNSRGADIDAACGQLKQRMSK